MSGTIKLQGSTRTGRKPWRRQDAGATETSTTPRLDCKPQALDATKSTVNVAEDASFQQEINNAPPGRDWLLPGSVRSYAEVGNPHSSSELSPYILTERSPSQQGDRAQELSSDLPPVFNHADEKKRAKLFEYRKDGIFRVLNATDVVIAAVCGHPRSSPPYVSNSERAQYDCPAIVIYHSMHYSQILPCPQCKAWQSHLTGELHWNQRWMAERIPTCPWQLPATWWKPTGRAAASSGIRTSASRSSQIINGQSMLQATDEAT